MVSKAPIKETLAAALILLTPWKKDRILVDPFCGSGTFPIEAAMMAAHMAPGMNRSFTAEDWTNILSRKCWYQAVDEANDLLDLDVKTDIQGYDIDPEMVKAARQNAAAAGVDHLIHFQSRPLNALSHPKNTVFSSAILPMENGWRRKKTCQNFTGRSESVFRVWTVGLCT